MPLARQLASSSLLIALVAAQACTGPTNGPGSSSSGASGHATSSSSSSSGSVAVDCGSQAGAVTLCDVQNTASPNHVDQGTEVTFPDPLVVTSDVFTLSTTNGVTTKAFFVAEGVGGAFRTGMVKGEGTQIDALALTVGTQLTLTVRVEEFAGTGAATETQLHFVGADKLSSPGVVPGATAIPAGTFSSDSSAEPYEGALVRIDNATATLFSDGCALVHYGAFRLEGGALVDDQLFKHTPGNGETFTSITGFVRYTYDGAWAILPRSADDVVSSGNTRTPQVVTVADLQDPANETVVPHCIPPDEGVPLKLEKMVVVSGIRVADKNAAGKATLYSVFVQDPSLLDSNNQPEPYSSMKIVFARTNIESTYAFSVYGDLDYPNTRDMPQDWPAIGDVIDVEGSVQEYFGNTQFGGVTKMTKLGTTADVSGVTMPSAKVLTGESVLGGLSGGAKGAPQCSMDTIGPGADSEQWENALVELQNVTTTEACVPTVTNSTEPPDCRRLDFGYFKVTGGVEIGTGQGTYYAARCPDGAVCTCEAATGEQRLPDDTRAGGKVYTSIKGIYEFSFEVFRVNPRGGQPDVVAQ